VGTHGNHQNPLQQCNEKKLTMSCKLALYFRSFVSTEAMMLQYVGSIPALLNSNRSKSAISDGVGKGWLEVSKRMQTLGGVA
jgi:hypothetical protein